MRVAIVTVFPELVLGFCGHALLEKAIASGRLVVEAIDPRDFATDRHRTVDDTPYGGGSGMVMKPGPLVDAMEEAERRSEARPPPDPDDAPGAAPSRRPGSDSWPRCRPLTLVCGRYEGVDERARRRVDEEISLGDFVLMGGEVAALALLEAVGRLQPGVLGNPESVEEESHAEGLLEHPHYTRPADFRGDAIPEVLVSGHHARVAAWRRRRTLRRTLERRPELLETASLTEDERAWIAAGAPEEDEP
jgi:tRNA (guanine37-N1)-methyltransferase